MAAVTIGTGARNTIFRQLNQRHLSHAALQGRIERVVR
jgi:hypothetical protein